jgi:hypothetical protein
MKRSGVRVSLKELQIAKVDKKNRVAPCHAELAAYLSAVAVLGEKSVPWQISADLTNCIEAKVFYLLLFIYRV